MFKFRLYTAEDSGGEFELSWHNPGVQLAPDTSDKSSSAPCIGAQNDLKS